MEQLHFTTRVLGKEVAERLKRRDVTQTLRSQNSNIVQAFLLQRIKVNCGMDIVLDDNKLGVALTTNISVTTLDGLSIDDARRGGFDSISELALALRRAGYRFKPIEQYKFYRIRFRWV